MKKDFEMVLIAGLGAGGGIGYQGTVPWHAPRDLRRFKRMTTGHAIWMGRKTFDSIGRALPKRQNVVLTRQTKFSHPGVEVVNNLESAREVSLAAGHKLVYVIGGAEIYKQCLPFADELALSYIQGSDPLLDQFDTFFPEVDLENDWKLVDQQNGGDHLFKRFTRREK